MSRRLQWRVATAESICVCADPEALAARAARHIASAARHAVAERGIFTLCLSGGDTPAATYECLGAAPDSMPWEHVHVFWGDERCIPLERPDNHHTMATRLMLSKVPIPPGNLYRPRGEAADPRAAAEEYEALLRRFFGAGAAAPAFDLVLLGMGEDGHVASLFPGSDGLVKRTFKRTRWVVDHDVVKRGQPAHRLTLTLPALTAAREVMVLVSGSLKAEMLAAVVEGEADVPAREVTSGAAEVLWLVDREAARALRANRIAELSR